MSKIVYNCRINSILPFRDTSGLRWRLVFLRLFRLQRTFTEKDEGPRTPSLSSDLVNTKSDPRTATGALKPALPLFSVVI